MNKTLFLLAEKHKIFLWNRMYRQQLLSKIEKIKKVRSSLYFYGKLCTFWHPKEDSNL